MTTSETVVEVVIPVQDVDAYLEEAIESVLHQTVAVAHTWVVDAGSHEPIVFPRKESIRSRCTLLRSDDRLYVGAARNLGVTRCRSAIVGFLDADDLWPIDRNRLLLEAMEREGSEWVYGCMESFSDAETAKVLRVPMEHPPAVVGGGGLFRRSVLESLGGFNGDLATGEFVDFAGRFRHGGFAETAIEEITLRRRIHLASTTASKSDLRPEYLKVVREHLERRTGGA